MKLAPLTGAAVSRSRGYHYSNTNLYVLHTGGVFQRRGCGCSEIRMKPVYPLGIFSAGSVLGSKRSNNNSVPKLKSTGPQSHPDAQKQVTHTDLHTRIIQPSPTKSASAVRPEARPACSPIQLRPPATSTAQRPLARLRGSVRPG